jgi:hypothetical protein
MNWLGLTLVRSPHFLNTRSHPNRLNFLTGTVSQLHLLLKQFNLNLNGRPARDRPDRFQ